VKAGRRRLLSLFSVAYSATAKTRFSLSGNVSVILDNMHLGVGVAHTTGTGVYGHFGREQTQNSGRFTNTASCNSNPFNSIYSPHGGIFYSAPESPVSFFLFLSGSFFQSPIGSLERRRPVTSKGIVGFRCERCEWLPRGGDACSSHPRRLALCASGTLRGDLVQRASLEPTDRCPSCGNTGADTVQ